MPARVLVTKPPTEAKASYGYLFLFRFHTLIKRKFVGRP